MLTYIYDPAQILAAQTAFGNCFRSAAANIVTVNVGFQGGSVELEVAWLPSVGIWSGSRKIENRYWNAFGAGEPDAHNSNSIICEINFPLIGMSAKIQGVLAKDENGAVWVCHRGGIGGGRKGIGANLFWQEFPGKWVSVSGDRVACIGAIGAPDFLDQVSNFVKFVQQIKPKNAMKAATR